MIAVTRVIWLDIETDRCPSGHAVRRVDTGAFDRGSGGELASADRFHFLNLLKHASRALAGHKRVAHPLMSAAQTTALGGPQRERHHSAGVVTAEGPRRDAGREWRLRRTVVSGQFVRAKRQPHPS